MGVQGLWSLLQPAARPIRLEDLEGKRFAVDSSIWLYHFRMAMRDKEGRTLANAHILGFFWRITKLLHFGLRPVFVFDGGAPVMKRQTLIGRKARRTGAKESHALAAKKLLNAQLRQAALQHVADGQATHRDHSIEYDDQGQRHTTGMAGNVVYFDDYGNAGGPSRGGAADLNRNPSGSRSPTKQTMLSAKSPSPVKGKKNIDYHRDPYALPNLNQDIGSITASPNTSGPGSGGPRRGRRNDFRFATDSELRHLLASITPSDIDMSSPLFRSLPFELQYELVGDMRAASRGTSYKRLQQMLKTSPTAIDFSRAQVLNLKNRNELTQKVFEVTDEIGDANIKIPIRVAGERNREYVLVRRGGDETGFVLGVRSQQGATQEKAIVVGEEAERLNISSDEDEDESGGRGRGRLKPQEDEDNDLELDEVEVPDTGRTTGQQRPSTISRSPSNAFKPSDANNPEVRRALAEQLMTKRAQEHIREKMKERGIVDDDEILEEQLRMARERLKDGGGRGEELFSPAKKRHRAKVPTGSNQGMGAGEDVIPSSDGEIAEVISDDDDAALKQLEEDELQDLAYALSASTGEGASRSKLGTVSTLSSSEPCEPETVLQRMYVAPAIKAEEQESIANFDAQAYADLYRDKTITSVKECSDEEGDLLDLEAVVPHPTASPGKAVTRQEYADGTDPLTEKSGPVLGFRRADRPGVRAGLDAKLFQRRKWYDEEGDAAAPDSGSGLTKPLSPLKLSQSPAQKSPVKSSTFPDFVRGMPSPSKAAHIREDMNSSSKIWRLETTRPQVTDSLFTQPFSCSAKSSRKEWLIKEAPPLRSTSAVVKEDDQGRREPSLEPLPRDDDLAATQILKAEEGVRSDQRGPSSLSAADGPELKAIDEEARISSEIVTGGQVSDASAEVSNLSASDQLGNRAAGVREEDIRPDISTSDAALDQQPANLGIGSSFPEPPIGIEVVQDQLKKQVERETNVLSTKGQAADDQDPSGGDAESEVSRSPSLSKNHRQSRRYDSDDGTPVEWSPSPSPGLPSLGPDGFPLPSMEEIEAMDAEYEAEAAALGADQGDIVSFLSRTKGQGLLEAQAEIAREVEALRAEHVNTKKSEEEITRQMAKEIQMMLRLFGLPYITAPMEAEAQCAELVSQKLVDGIITDDSDVFLFGGTRVYKNMFNNNKVVECFLLSDLQRELGLDREKLVRLAYLLGSDYTEGLASVGPVVAMELLSLFPGEDGLLRFKEWWLKVQSGRDTPEDTKGKTMRRIKKTLANKVHLDNAWPNPAVLDAYYEPAVDSSDEAFQWGLPDLDSLRTYLAEYLGWSTTKTDQYVVPVIEAQSRRSRARGNQTTLDRNGFFDISGGNGVYAGRTLPQYGSSRLQNVVNGFRMATKGAGGSRSKSINAASGRRPGEGKQSAQKQRKSELQSTRQKSQVMDDGLAEEDMHMVSPAVLGNPDTDVEILTLPEEAIGKAMAYKRPIVRRDQMRVDDRQAQEELNANIIALEGNSGSATRSGVSASGASSGGGKKVTQKRNVNNLVSQEVEVEASNDPSSPQGSEDDSGEEFLPPSSSNNKRRKTATKGGSEASRTSRGRGRGTGVAARGEKSRTTPKVVAKKNAGPDIGGQVDVENSVVEEEPLPDVPTATTTSTPSVAVRGRRAARARGARGGPRHATLSAARNLRLDGPLPESVSSPLRPDTVRRSRSSSSAMSTTTTPASAAGGARSPFTATTATGNEASRVGTPNMSLRQRERIEIELRSDDDDDDDDDDND